MNPGPMALVAMRNMAPNSGLAGRVSPEEVRAESVVTGQCA
jgi:hypothetical protein